LLAYLQQLRTNPTPGALRPKLVHVLNKPEDALVRDVGGLEVPPGIVPTVQRSQVPASRQ